MRYLRIVEKREVGGSTWIYMLLERLALARKLARNSESSLRSKNTRLQIAMQHASFVS